MKIFHLLRCSIHDGRKVREISCDEYLQYFTLWDWHGGLIWPLASWNPHRSMPSYCPTPEQWRTIEIPSICTCVHACMHRVCILTIISTTTHHIFSILELWTHIKVLQDWLTYHHAPVIFCQILTSDLLIGFWPLSPQLFIALLPYWNCELT